jgi:hypothetical protein
MLYDYYCSACHLAFSLGWLHMDAEDKYPAASFIVCKKCGTMHTLLFGKTTRIPKADDKENASIDKKSGLKTIPDQVNTLAKPLIAPRDQDFYASVEEAIVRSKLEWVHCGEFEDIRPHRKVPLIGITEGCEEELCLDHIACGSCGIKGQFLIEPSESNLPAGISVAKDRKKDSRIETMSVNHTAKISRKKVKEIP